MKKHTRILTGTVVILLIIGIGVFARTHYLNQNVEVIVCPAEEAEQSESLESEQPTEEPLSANQTDDYPALIMVNGKLYKDSGELDTADGRCGMMDGAITSTCDTTPEQDGQSNFGTGYGYQYGRTESSIEVLMDDGWHIFTEFAIL